MTIKYTTPSNTEIMTTALNSLADGSQSAASTEINNETGLNTFASFTLKLASIGSARDGHCQLYVRYETTDTDGYEDEDHFLGVFKLPATSAAAVASILGVRLEPFNTQFYVTNDSGQALAASGNTLDIETYNYEDA